MQDLFATATGAPLAERMRPQTIDEVVGQSHLLGPGKPLRVAFESGRPHSMILWGPPGVGKTTLARLMANAFGLDFIAISAVLGGVKDIRDAVERAQGNRARTGQPTVVFVDEVHRFNKAQQDAFLPHVESGLFVFVGATTENPSFEVDRRAALARGGLCAGAADRRGTRSPDRPRACADRRPRSRCGRAPDADRSGRRRCAAPAERARGGRNAARDKGTRLIDAEFVRAALPATLRRFDKGGENFYDQISALHKSVRGSDPDAALYWMMRMLDGGTDPRYVARRVVRMAIEDIGLADPRGLEIALAAAETYERLGSPEGELAIAQAVVYLAVAPKSNAVYTAFNAARAFVQGDASRPVPMRLRNAPTRLMKDLGYGTGYRYAHDEPDAYAAGELPTDAAAFLCAGRAGRRGAHPPATGRASRPTRGRPIRKRAPPRHARLRSPGCTPEPAQGKSRHAIASAHVLTDFSRRTRLTTPCRAPINKQLSQAPPSNPRCWTSTCCARTWARSPSGCAQGFELDVAAFNALEAERKAVQVANRGTAGAAQCAVETDRRAEVARRRRDHGAGRGCRDSGPGQALRNAAGEYPVATAPSCCSECRTSACLGARGSDSRGQRRDSALGRAEVVRLRGA